LIVGLTNDSERLIQLRRNRLDLLHHEGATEYTDLEAVRAEVREARRIFAQMHWPVIDMVATIFGTRPPDGLTPIKDERVRGRLGELFLKARLGWRETNSNQHEGRRYIWCARSAPLP
jgi:hypothetical protein